LIRIQDVRVTPASAAEARGGLLAYLALTLPGNLRVDGLTLRRSVDRRLYVAYPERTAASGERSPILHPLTPAARAELQGLIIAEGRRQRLGK